MSIVASAYRGFDVDWLRTGEHRRLVITNPETGEVIHDDAAGKQRRKATAEQLIDTYLAAMSGQPRPEETPEVSSAVTPREG